MAKVSWVMAVLLWLLQSSICSPALAAENAVLTANDAFEPMRDWWYRGALLPAPGSPVAKHMQAAYATNPNDPEVMQWTAVAQSQGVFRTDRHPRDLSLAAATKGKTMAIVGIARAYLDGSDNHPQDTEKALRMLNEAPEAGEPTAAYELGRVIPARNRCC
jgi:hypothetical protein